MPWNFSMYSGHKSCYLNINAAMATLLHPSGCLGCRRDAVCRVQCNDSSHKSQLQTCVFKGGVALSSHN